MYKLFVKCVWLLNWIHYLFQNTRLYLSKKSNWPMICHQNMYGHSSIFFRDVAIYASLCVNWQKR